MKIMTNSEVQMPLDCTSGMFMQHNISTMLVTFRDLGFIKVHLKHCINSGTFPIHVGTDHEHQNIFSQCRILYRVVRSLPSPR